MKGTLLIGIVNSYVPLVAFRANRMSWLVGMYSLTPTRSRLSRKYFTESAWG